MNMHSHSQEERNKQHYQKSDHTLREVLMRLRVSTSKGRSRCFACHHLLSIQMVHVSTFIQHIFKERLKHFRSKTTVNRDSTPCKVNMQHGTILAQEPVSVGTSFPTLCSHIQVNSLSTVNQFRTRFKLVCLTYKIVATSTPTQNQPLVSPDILPLLLAIRGWVSCLIH